MKRLKDDAGYSLVEVMMAIVIIAIAIIPMVGMFDVGLKSATAGSSYDQARALANKNLEIVRALPYNKPGGLADSAVEIYAPGTRDCPEGAASLESCKVTTKHVNPSLVADATFKDIMQVDVEVKWDSGGNSYTTTGVISRGNS